MDAIVGVLVQKLFEILSNEACEVLEFHNQFKTLKEELLFMHGYLKDVDTVRMKDRKETLKIVSGKLRELLYDAEDIITDCELFLRQQTRRASKCMSYCSPSILKFRYRMGKRLREINEKIMNHKETMTSYLVSLPNQEHVRISQVGRYPILMNDDDIVGLDNDAKTIKQWILEAHGQLIVIGIVGMGGIGKTTLAQKIIHDNSVNSCFDHTLFVIVSQSFKFKEIVKNMLRKLNVKEDALKKDEYEILEELRRQLTDKKYLVILDDVWRIDEDPWWESLKSALPQKNDGSCVIVTTRNKYVAQSMGASEMHIYHPKNLSDDDSWSLFAKIAFAREGGRCPNPDLEGIGKEIVAKCGGLPLAIKLLGGMMQGKEHSVYTWRRIFENLKKELAFNKKDESLISALTLSYEDLPTHLKPCILCFSVFPEDFEISIYSIIYWWIGEGFVRSNDGRTAYEIGEECFDELISRCLLLGVCKDPFDRRFYTCKLHDMVRDMIIKIAKEENFMGFDDSSFQSRRVGRNTTNMDFFREIKLRTIVGIDIEESKKFSLNFVEPKLCQLKWLRVLNISFKGRGEYELPGMDWLSGIGSLPHLICLKIGNSHLDTLPISIGSLLNLQILFLWNCTKLKRLPVQITCLEKLTILSTNYCDSLECMPMGIGNLSHLEQLWGFVPANSRAKDGARLSELKKLTQLRRLGIHIKSDDQIKEGDFHVLSELKKLENLSIKFKDEINEKEQLIRKVDYELHPIQQLKELRLLYYPGERTPVWLNPTSLPNLLFLGIGSANITRLSPEFFGNSQENKVWKLEGLALVSLEELEEEWPTMQRAIPSLRLLKVEFCPKLKSLFPSNVSRYGRYTWSKEQAKGQSIGTSEEAQMNNESIFTTQYSTLKR